MIELRNKDLARCLSCSWFGEINELIPVLFTADNYELTNEEFEELDKNEQENCFEEYGCPDCGSTKIEEDITHQTFRNERNISFLRKKVKRLEKDILALTEIIDYGIKNDKKKVVKKIVRQKKKKTVKKRKRK